MPYRFPPAEFQISWHSHADAASRLGLPLPPPGAVTHKRRSAFRYIRSLCLSSPTIFYEEGFNIGPWALHPLKTASLAAGLIQVPEVQTYKQSTTTSPPPTIDSIIIPPDAPDDRNDVFVYPHLVSRSILSLSGTRVCSLLTRLSRIQTRHLTTHGDNLDILAHSFDFP